MKLLPILLVGCWALAGCESMHYITMRTDPDRAKLGSEVIAVTMANPDPRGADGGVVVSDEARGTWTFTVPTNVTQVERKTDAFDRYSLYMGQPKPDDVPFMTLTVTRDRSSLAESDPNGFKTAATREYTMNAAIAKEWTGTTSGGAGFCELIVRKPGDTGKGSVCHAVALARSEEEQKVALSVLSSIVWKAE